MPAPRPEPIIDDMLEDTASSAYVGEFSGSQTSDEEADCSDTSRGTHETSEEEEDGRSDTPIGTHTWKLVTAAPGGPQIIELIPSFGGHIANRLWIEGLDSRLLSGFKFHTRHKAVKNCAEHEFGNPAAQGLVEASGLYHLREIMSSHLDFALLEAFVERWQPDTNTFHMPFGEMTITLHDVFHILRLPVKGAQLDCDVPMDYKKRAMKMFGVSEEEFEAFYENGGLCVDTVLSYADDFYGSGEARCYLFCLLGSTLFVDNSGSRARIGILESLMDLEAARGYAWGAATLAYMYRQLGVASRAQTTSLCGCMTLLQSWIYEYFPVFRRVQRPADRGTDAPLAGRWDELETADMGGYEAQARLDEIRGQLDGMTSRHVEWLPYGVEPYRGDALWSLYRGGLYMLDIIELHDPSRVLRQYGYRQCIPDSPIPPITAFRSEVGKEYSVKHSNYKYSAVGALVGLHYFSTPVTPGDRDEDVFPNYMAWYTPRTHPYIIPSSATQVSSSDMLTLKLASQIINGLAPLFEAETLEDFRALAPFDLVQSVKGLWIEYRKRCPYLP